MIKILPIAMLLVATSLGAKAQTDAPAQSSTNQTGDQFLAANLRDQPIYAPDGAGLGEIDDLLIDRGGQVRAAIINLGRASTKRLVTVPFSALDIQRPPTSGAEPQSVKVFLRQGRAELEKAPEFKPATGR